MLTAMTRFLRAPLMLLALSASPSYGQKYDLKKDIIYRGKTPYAKFSGEMGLLKPADVLISSLNGDSLMTIKQWKYPSGNPVFDFLNGYEIKFIRSGKRFAKTCEVTLSGKEQFLNFILAGKNYAGKWEILFPESLIVDNQIDPAMEEAFIQKFDNAKTVAWAQAYEQKEREVLQSLYPSQKPKGTQLRLEYLGGDASMPGGSATIDVYYGKLIATIIKTHGSAGTYTYSFEYTLPQKIKVEGKEIGTIIIATATVDNFPEIFVNADGKAVSIQVATPGSAERQLTEFLINNNKL